jgi:hypothetical protein
VSSGSAVTLPIITVGAGFISSPWFTYAEVG